MHENANMREKRQKETTKTEKKERRTRNMGCVHGMCFIRAFGLQGFEGWRLEDMGVKPNAGCEARVYRLTWLTMSMTVSTLCT